MSNAKSLKVKIGTFVSFPFFQFCQISSDKIKQKISKWIKYN